MKLGPGLRHLVKVKAVVQICTIKPHVYQHFTLMSLVVWLEHV